MSRRVVVAAVAVAYVMSGCAHSAAPTAVSAPRAPRPSPLAASPAGVAPAAGAAPRAAAERVSHRLLNALAVPPGAVRVHAPPVGSQEQQAALEPESGNLVDSTAWWTLTLTQPAALAWLRAHRPAGTVEGLRASDDDGGHPVVVDNGLASQQYEAPSLVLSLAPFGRTGSALRADAEVVWDPDRTAAEHMPTAAGTTLTLAYRRTATGPYGNRRVIGGVRAGQLARAFNALRTLPPRTSTCGAGDGVSFELTSPAGLSAETSSACELVYVTLHGRLQQTLQLNEQLESLLLAAAGRAR